MNSKTFVHLMLYGIFGVLTTVLAWVLYWAGTRLLGLGAVHASAWAWFLAVLFSYFTNRKYVFHSEVIGFTGTLKECISFMGSRLGTGIFDLAVTYIFIDVMGLYDMWVKIISNVLVIVMNYVLSEIVVFRKNRT